MTRPLRPDDFHRIRLAEDPRISPDGRQVAYVLVEVDAERYRYRLSIRVLDETGEERTLTGPDDAGPRWSPDGRWLAFVRRPEPGVKPLTEAEQAAGVGRPQLWVIPSEGGEARQLTRLRNGCGDPVWAPDGRRLVVVAAVGEGDDPESERPGPDELRVPSVRRLDRLWYRVDGEGWIYDRRRHLFLVDAAGGEATQLTDGDWDDTHPSWSPDGSRIAFTSDRSAARWSWPAAAVWVLDVAGGAVTRISDEDDGCERAAWSPDGARLAWRAVRRREHSGFTDVRVAPSGGGDSLLLTGDFIPTCHNATIDDQRAGHGADDVFWSVDGREVLALASAAGETHLWALAADGGARRQVTEGRRVLFGVSAAGDGQRLAIAMSDPATPGDVALIDLAGGWERRLTSLNHALFAEAPPLQPAEFSCRAADGAELQGWVLRPDPAPPGPLPAVLEIHGGPQAMYGWGFMLEFQLLAGAGVAVVYGNPRGSCGYGREFSGAVMGDWGGGDHADLTLLLDTAIAQQGLDAARLGVAGGSYGGYMTLWMIGHSDRFRAAVAMRSVSNFATTFGTSDFGWEIVDGAGGTPWGDGAKLAERSPVTYVTEMRTPLLLLHSDRDLRCPISESEQVFAALKYLGREVELVRFEGQSHDLSRSGHPRSRVIRLGLILDWMRAHGVMPPA
ncbi:MAG TPA: S9 family peptidase [Candidatus Dormibacteraeota bacterium]|nr:S9 family peptidase [Candidatus Dormibacteraeota bacterium]